MEIKNFYRYCVLVNEIGRPFVQEEEIPMEITRNNSLTRQNNPIEILGYAEAHTDYGFVPYYENMGKVIGDYLWLEERDIEKARDLFVAKTRSKIQQCFREIEKLKEQIQIQGDYLKALDDIVYQVRNYSPDDLSRYDSSCYEEFERDE